MTTRPDEKEGEVWSHPGPEIRDYKLLKLNRINDKNLMNNAEKN
jgi:hypothetical protein